MMNKELLLPIKTIIRWVGVLCVLLFPLMGSAQVINNNSLKQTFRIGFLRNDLDGTVPQDHFNRLRLYLLSNPDIKTNMALAGVEDIVLQSFDSNPLLVEAMDGEQLDLVFCGVLDYASQKGDYEPVFQIRKSGDAHSSSGGSRVWYSGVIFVNNLSPLFRLDTTTTLELLPEYLAQREIAMVGANSAAGYVYPLLSIADLTTDTQSINKQRVVFWNSSADVVKAVLNGIHEVGACEANILDNVLLQSGLAAIQKDLVRVILKTNPIPRDPVVLHNRWLAGETGFRALPEIDSLLGRELLRGIQEYYESLPEGVKLERTSPETFTEVSENLERFQEIRRNSVNSSSQ